MNEIDKIKKILNKHDKRIGKLENLSSTSFKRKKKKEKKSITDLLIEVSSEGFFDKPKTRKEIVEKFGELGSIYDGGSLNYPLLQAIKSRILGRVKVKGKWGYVKR